MSDIAPCDLADLQRRLVADLTAVPVVRGSWKRTLAWSVVLVGAGAGLAMFGHVSTFLQRIEASPDMWISFVASSLTSITAAVAAFQSSLPDRSTAWRYLPAPFVLLWLLTSGLGCARDWLVPGTHAASMAESAHCIVGILALSAPLSILIFALLRRGYSLNPSSSAITAGLAVAAAAATLVNIDHPYDTAAVDLLFHAIAIALVLAIIRIWGTRLLHARTAWRGR